MKFGVPSETGSEPKSPYKLDKSAPAPAPDIGYEQTILVSGVTDAIVRDLKAFFENTNRSGGGSVNAIKLDSALGQALVTFKDSAGK